MVSERPSYSFDTKVWPISSYNRPRAATVRNCLRATKRSERRSRDEKKLAASSPVESTITEPLAGDIRQPATQSHGSRVRSGIQGNHDCDRDRRAGKGRGLRKRRRRFLPETLRFAREARD